ncbi:MAG: ABC transporter substrate-binding protein [Alphaproteobacteria bacterium]|nr:ABC transporter substrate-binding protein [Alphaproteobacteria bacterium]
MNRLVRLALVLLTAATVVSCGQPTAQKSIGVVAPLTGEGATYGASMKRGIELAMEGSGIKLIYEDDKLSPKDGVAAIQKLISLDNVSIVYGSAASGVTSAIVPIADQNKVVLFSSISTADSLNNAGPYFFRNVPANSIQGKTAAEFVANTLKGHTVAIFNKNDEYGTNLASSFRQHVRALGLQIAYDSSYQPTDTDFRNQLLKIKNAGVDAVFIPGNYQDTGIILKQASELGITAVWIGGDGSYSPSLLQYAGPAAEGFICTIMAVDQTTPMYKDFESRFLKAYGRKPDVYDTYAYEAGLILRQLVEKGGANYKQILDSTTFNSFSGPLKFVNGQVDRAYGLVQVKNGQFVPR